MRLLHASNDGELSFTNNLPDQDAPPYAILSHTWGSDDEEITFQDFSLGSKDTQSGLQRIDLTDEAKKSTYGFQKISFCARQAAKDGLQYFWVDTCCIDKTNSVELQEAITSMFRWYSKAVKCYVHLRGVSTDRKRKRTRSSHQWEQDFNNNRWFKRGWTLQELLAPSSVEFFSENETKLGDKKSLSTQIVRITNIPEEALRGASLSDFSSTVRMSWANERQTKKPEDGAYCLLGIFGVSMTPLYGEGKQSAFHRLQSKIAKKEYPDLLALDSLPYAVEAPFNSMSSQTERTCLENTRTELLQGIYDWVDEDNGQVIFWLRGLAGTGKSTIVRTVSEHYERKERLGASFFFSRGGGDVGNAGKFVTTIAVQLARAIPALRPGLKDALIQNSDISTRRLAEQWAKLVLGPLSKTPERTPSLSYILTVDALDECDEEHSDILVRLLAQLKTLTKTRIKVFLTSRPEMKICHEMSQIPSGQHRDCKLHDIAESIVDHDIRLFLQNSLSETRNMFKFINHNWPDDETIEQLVRAADHLFIWAATACRYVHHGGPRLAKLRLAGLAKSENRLTANSPHRHLDNIYTQVLSSVYGRCEDEERDEMYSGLKLVLGSIVTLFAPLSRQSLNELMRNQLGDLDVSEVVGDLQSILDIPSDENLHIRLHHPSFRDFLLDRERCTNLDLWVDKRQAHANLARGCLEILTTSLRQDILDLGTPGLGMAATEVFPSRLEEHIPPELQYSCLYWIHHVQESGTKLADHGAEHEFLQKHLLQWLEALAWMGKTSEGIHAVLLLDSIIDTHDCGRLSNYVHDIRRFVLYSRGATDQAPLQIYSSALAYAPMQSEVRRQFEYCIPGWMQAKPIIRSAWSDVLQSLEINARVNDITFSPDGKTVACTLVLGSVMLLDAASGARLQVLVDHGNPTAHDPFAETQKLIFFQPEARFLIQIFSDMIKIWDVLLGIKLRSIPSGSHSIHSGAAALSADGATIAWASRGEFRLWDNESGALVRSWRDESYSGENYSGGEQLQFSTDAKTLTFIRSLGMPRRWDVRTGALLELPLDHLNSDSIHCLALSPTAKLAAFTQSRRIFVVNLDTSAEVCSFEYCPENSQYFIAVFSPDCTTLACFKRHERSVQMYDVTTGASRIVKFHIDIRCAAFSPNSKMLAASALVDGNLALVDLTQKGASPMPPHHERFVRAIVFSPDATTLVSASYDATAMIWDAESGQLLHTLYSAIGRLGRCLFSSDGKRLCLAGREGRLVVWSTNLPQELPKKLIAIEAGPYMSGIDDVILSPDGSRVVFMKYKNSDQKSVGAINLFNIDSSQCLLTEKFPSNLHSRSSLTSIAELIAVPQDDGSIKIFSGRSAILQRTLPSQGAKISHLAFSSDDCLLASLSEDGSITVWDAQRGEQRQVVSSSCFATENKLPHILVISPDGTHFAETSDHKIYLWFLNQVTIINYTNFFSNELSFLDNTKIQIRHGQDCHTIALNNDDGLPKARCGLEVKEGWVLWNRTRVLWVPSEYTGQSCISNKNRMATAGQNGSVLIMSFDFTQL